MIKRKNKHCAVFAFVSNKIEKTFKDMIYANIKSNVSFDFVYVVVIEHVTEQIINRVFEQVWDSVWGQLENDVKEEY